MLLFWQFWVCELRASLQGVDVNNISITIIVLYFLFNPIMQSRDQKCQCSAMYHVIIVYNQEMVTRYQVSSQVHM